MQFSCSTVLLAAVALAGTCMCCICGYMALDGTLDLFDKYGPREGRGNPAKDDPPNYLRNSQTGEQELVNPAVPGNILPQVFKGIQYYLIAIGVFMAISVLVLFIVISLIQRAFYELIYNGVVTSWTNLRYTIWLTGYTAFLALVWLIMTCFCVLPLVEYVITIQRCHDLDNTVYPSKNKICVDLVQYGLVPYREMHNSGYGLICGQNAHNWGNLEGLCENYSPNFNLYIVCFVGACLTLIATVLYVMRGLSLYFSLKPLFGPAREHPADMYKSNTYKQPPVFAHNPYNNYGNSVHNPNYENNVLLTDPLLQPPSNAGSYPVLSVPPGGDGIEMKKRYYSDAGDHATSRRSEKSIVRSSSSSVVPNDVHTYSSQRAPSYQTSKMSRHPSTDSMEKVRPKGSLSNVNRKQSNRERPSVRQTSSELDSDLEHHDSSDVPSDQNRSATAYRPRPIKKKTRNTRSDPDIARKSGRRVSSRKNVPTIDEYESPPSDYYLQEDMERRTLRGNSRTRSVY